MLKERTYRTSCKSTYRILDITSLLLLILKHSWVVDIVTQVHTEALTEKTLCKELILFFEGSPNLWIIISYDYKKKFGQLII
ncbi:uncharacterized protein LOC144297911 isoform X6 [Canis aureus]